MDDIQLWSQSVDWVSIVVNVAVIVLPTLATIIVTALVGAQTLPAFRKFVRSLRSFVDQPTDSAVKFLADQLGMTEEQVIAALTKVIDEISNVPPKPLVPVPAAAPAPVEPLLPPVEAVK